MDLGEFDGRGYRSLIVWQRAMDFAVHVLDACDSLSARAGAGIVSQLRRCAVSVPSNIAEGHRRPASEQLVFLRHSRGSLWEAATQIEILGRRGKLKTETVLALLRDGDEVGRLLHGYMTRIDSDRNS
jgi:four helix bundle protein